MQKDFLKHTVTDVTDKAPDPGHHQPAELPTLFVVNADIVIIRHGQLHLLINKNMQFLYSLNCRINTRLKKRLIKPEPLQEQQDSAFM